MEKLVLKDVRHSWPDEEYPFTVVKAFNTTRFYIGQRLSVQEVQKLINKHWAIELRE
jgi:hypothetical protein